MSVRTCCPVTYIFNLVESGKTALLSHANGNKYELVPVVIDGYTIPEFGNKVSERKQEPQTGFHNWVVPLTKSARLFFNGKNGHLYLQIDRQRGRQK